jgi:hypothetical protein
MEKMYTTEIEMKKFLENKNYLVIYPDASLKLFKSLREIQHEILVDASTISKKLKNTEGCYCLSKSSGFMFYVKKMN